MKGMLTWIVVASIAGVFAAAFVGAGCAREYDTGNLRRKRFAAGSRVGVGLQPQESVLIAETTIAHHR